MADTVQRVSDMLSAPMEQVITALGTGIARAQRELDRYAIESQREINQDPLLSEAGLQATFYQIPKAELELTMAIAREGEPTTAKAAGRGTRAALPVFRLKQLHFQPVNAAYTSQFSFDVQASSKLKLTVVPVPPPGAEAAITPQLSREEVEKIASSKLVAAQAARLAVNFNGQVRLWFVLQYVLEGDAVRRLALVVVDDQTKKIVKAETGS
jgi:hypothetical protein